METSTQTRKHTRELTKTEIELATAQIIDRLTRFVSAKNEYYEMLESIPFLAGETFEQGDSRVSGSAKMGELRIKEKYDIPGAVSIQSDAEIELRFVCRVKPWIKRWVAGIMQATDVEFFVQELEGVWDLNMGWVFLESTKDPSWDGAEFKIGSRSKKKYCQPFPGLATFGVGVT